MNWRNELEHEHDLISKLIDQLNIKTIEIFRTKHVNINWMNKCLYFITNYADKYHHEKEENLLFDLLSKENKLGATLVNQGMLVEHQQGRYYIKQLKKLLSANIDDESMVKIIGYSQSYIDLLCRHIDKENNVAFPYAEKVLNNKDINNKFSQIQPSTLESELLLFLSITN